MSIKLILGVALAVFISLFTGFNLDNKASLWFFHTFKDLPVVALVLGGFVLGVIVTILAFAIGGKKKK